MLEPPSSSIHTMNLISTIGHRLSEGANAANLAFFILIVALIAAPMIAGLVRVPAMVALVLVGMTVGPHGLGVLATNQIALGALGDFGLLYLMFNAGLELDLRKLVRNERAAVAFAALSFVIPFSLGLVGARLLGYVWAAAVLMGSNWGSHTLVTYPMLRELGLAHNRAITTVVGATALTDTSALLVLAAVSVVTRRTGSFLAEGAELMLGLAILAVWSSLGLPRLARRFFAHVGANPAQRFLFALGAFFLGAMLAEVAGIDGIVGAFFAGLGLGRAIPEQSPLMERVQFVGGALFVPIFMVSVGVLLDPAVLSQPRTLLYALVFTLAVLGGKALAAVVVGTRAGFSRPEIGVMSGLSGSQAAATLATTLVGARLGLFDAVTINAILVVILATLTITSIVVEVCGRDLAAATPQQDIEALGRTILVRVSGTSTRPLLGLARRLAEPDTGIVLAGVLVSEDADDAELNRQRRLRTEAAAWLAGEGLEARSLLRVSRSNISGLVETARGEGATLVMTEWAPSHGFDDELREVVSKAPVPILLAHGEVESFERLIVVVDRAQLSAPPGRRDLELAHELCDRLAHQRTVMVVAVSLNDRINALFAHTPHAERLGRVDPLGWVKDNARRSDLVLLLGLGELNAARARMPEIMNRRFLVGIAARSRR